MKKWFAYGAIFLSVYLFFVVALLPASLVVKSLPQPKNLVLSGVSGSVWQTKIHALQYDQLVLEDIRVSLQPLSLITFNPAVDVAFGNAVAKSPEGQLQLQNLLSQPQVVDANIFIAANDIATQLPSLIPITAHGNVNLVLEQFVFGQPVCQQVNGDVRWQNAAVTAMDEKVKLGHFRASLGCDQGALAINVDEKNDLGLSFSAFVRQQGQVSGNGYLAPGESFPDALKPVLNFLGTPDKDGRYRLRM